jgi:hypothetical protein
MSRDEDGIGALHIGDPFRFAQVNLEESAHRRTTSYGKHSLFHPLRDAAFAVERYIGQLV